MITHGQGIVQLADVVMREYAAAGRPDLKRFLRGRFESIAATWARCRWSRDQIETGLRNLGAAVHDRLTEAADPMDGLAKYICGIAAGNHEVLNAGFAKVRAAIDAHETVPKVERDKIFGRFAFGVALRVVQPTGRA